MPEFTYTGDEGRLYPDLAPPANHPKPGETYSLPKDPGDDRWKPHKSRKSANEEKP